MGIESKGDASRSLNGEDPELAQRNKAFLDDSGYAMPANASERAAIRKVAEVSADDRVAIKEPPVQSQPALTPAQMESPQVLFAIHSKYSQESDDYKKAIDPKSFAELAPAWEKAIESNKSVSPELIASYEAQFHKDFDSALLMSLALEKSRKSDFNQLIDADFKLLSSEDLERAETESQTRWQTVNQELSKAHEALTQEQKEKYAEAENKFREDFDSASKGKNSAELQELGRSLMQARNAEIKSLSPEMSKAIDDFVAALNDPKVVAAKQFLENMQAADTFKHVDQYRLQFAMALNLQGGDENNRKAAGLVQESMKNPAVAEILQGTADGEKLLHVLGLHPDSASDRIYPEAKVARQATAALSDTSLDPKQRWTKAEELYKEAEKLIDDDVMARGQGKDLADSVSKLHVQLDLEQEAIHAGAERLSVELNKYKTNPGMFSASENQKLLLDKILSQSKGSGAAGAITKDDVLGTLLANNGPEMLASMKDLLKEKLGELPERDRIALNSLEKNVVLEEKLGLVTSIRFQHAIATSQYGFNNNDDLAKAKANELIESIKSIEPTKYRFSPEFLGVLKQAELGKMLDVSEGKAAALAYHDAALSSIAIRQSGPIDLIIPGVSPAIETYTGLRTSEIPVLGALLGGGNKKDSERITAQLAYVQISNATEAQKLREQVSNDATTQAAGLAGDLAGVLASFTGAGSAIKGVQLMAAEAPGWIKAPIGLGVALSAGGVTNNAVSDYFKGDKNARGIFAVEGFENNLTAAGFTYLAIKGREFLPGNQLVSGERLSKLGLDSGSKIKASRVGDAVIQQRETEKLNAIEASLSVNSQNAAVRDLVGLRLGIPPVESIATSMQERLVLRSAEAGMAAERLNAKFFNKVNPLNYTPLSLSSWRPKFVGFGGEKTLQSFVDGKIGVYEFRARQANSTTMSIFAGGFAFGATRKGLAIYNGEHLDGKTYDWNRTMADMTVQGLNVGLTSAVLLPFAGRVLGPTAKTYVSDRVTSVFAKLPGVVNPDAATRGLGAAALLWAQPLAQSNARTSEAKEYEKDYQAAKQLEEDKQRKIDQEKKKRQDVQ